MIRLGTHVLKKCRVGPGAVQDIKASHLQLRMVLISQPVHLYGEAKKENHI